MDIELGEEKELVIEFITTEPQIHIQAILLFLIANNIHSFHIRKEENIIRVFIYKDNKFNIGTFLDNLDIFFAQESILHEYKAHKGALYGVLLRERKKEFDHKDLLIKGVSILSNALLNKIKKDKKLLYQIHPRIFEELVAEIFSSVGFSVELTKRSRDGGKDIVAIKYDLGIPSRWVIECKRFINKNKIDIKLVRELFGVKQAGNYQQAVLVTTSSFTKPALDFERQVVGLSLKNYNALMKWLNNYTFSTSGGLYLKTKD